LGGLAGSAEAAHSFEVFKKDLATYAPGFTLVHPEGYVVTDWDAGKKRQVMAGLLAKYGDLAAVVSDYLGTDIGTVQAINDAKAKMPAFVGIASSQGWVCTAQKNKIQWFSQDGVPNIPAVSLRVGLALLAGKSSPESLPYKLPIYADTAAGKTPACEPGVSPDADLSANLTLSQVKALLK
jgi:ribose transport system substrate-binding protein